MAGIHTRFYRDKQNGKWSGVCAGLADYFGVDVNWIRVGFVLLTLVTGPWTLLAYFVMTWSAPVRPAQLGEDSPEEKKFWQQVRKSPKSSARVVRGRLREIDRRLANAEAYFTSPHSRLAREIDNLR